MAKVKTRWSKKRRDLQEIVAPWFLFLTTFRRNASSMEVSQEWVREKLRGMLADMKAAVEADPNLKLTLDEALYPLVCFADEVLLTSGWSEEGLWERELLEMEIFRSQNAGQEFFARLEEVESGNTDLIQVYYKCLCLGFGGQYMDKPLRLREEREKLLARLDQEKRSGPRFCPRAYEHTDKRDFVKLPMVATARIAIAALALAVMILWVSGMVIESTLERVDSDLASIKAANDSFAEKGIWKEELGRITADRGGEGPSPEGRGGR